MLVSGHIGFQLPMQLRQRLEEQSARTVLLLPDFQLYQLLLLRLSLFLFQLHLLQFYGFLQRFDAPK